MELPDPPVLHLQTVKVLILGEDACFAEKARELTQKGSPLPVGHKPQSQRGDYRVDTVVPPTVYFLLKRICTGVNNNQAGVGDI